MRLSAPSKGMRAVVLLPRVRAKPRALRARGGLVLVWVGGAPTYGEGQVPKVMKKVLQLAPSRSDSALTSTKRRSSLHLIDCTTRTTLLALSGAFFWRPKLRK